MPKNIQQRKALEEKAKEILETDKVTPQSKPSKIHPKLLDLFSNRFFQIILTFILLITLFATTLFISYLTIKKQQTEASKKVVPESEIQLPIVDTTKETDETADWKTYTNSDIGMLIKYPSSWNIELNSPPETLQIQVGFKKDNVGEIMIYKLVESPRYQTTLEEWYNSLATPEVPFVPYGSISEITSRKQVEIDGVGGIHLTTTTEHAIVDDIYLPIQGGVMTISIIPSEASKNSDVTQILSTFRFIDRSLGASAKWDKFTDQEVQGVSTTSCLETEQDILEEISECEEVDENKCLALKKEFDSCVLACLKDLKESSLCFAVCKPVCDSVKEN